MTNRTTATIVIDALSAVDAVDATFAAARALVDAGVAGEIVVLHDEGARLELGESIGVVGDPAAPGGSANAAVRATSAEVIVYLRAGLVPTVAWVESMVDALLTRHVAAVAAPAGSPDGGPGGVSPRPAGLSFVGHPLPFDPNEDIGPAHPTLFPGEAWVAWREDLADIQLAERLTRPAMLVDLGWRLWLRWGGVVVDGAPIAGSPAPDPERSVAVTELDALVTIYRNLDAVSLAAALPAAFALSPLRAAAAGAGDDASRGLDDFVAGLDGLADERERIQSGRRRPDAEMIELFGAPLRADCDDPAFGAAHRSLTRALPMGARFGGRHRIVVATRDALAPRMAGPGIRAWNVARELAKEHDVRLVSLTQAQLSDPDFSIEQVTENAIANLVEWCDIFIFQGWVMYGRPCFEREDRIFVVDIYDPLHLEQLEQARDDGEFNRRRAVRGATDVLNDQLGRGDFFVCASEKQRDFWLGHLASQGRINPVTYDHDPTLRSQLAVVPFGVPDHPARRTRAAIKGVLPGVGADDPVILWGGGVYNWFDPLTLIRAVDKLRERIPNVRLVFLGMRHPNDEVPEMRMAMAARALAADLGLAGSTVIFNEEWVAYEDRENFFLDADVGVTTHLHHIETEFAFRTRVLDYLWAGLPTVATSGDALADLIEREALGITVPPGDVDALEAALFRLLDDGDFAAGCRERIAAVRPQFAWSVALKPLVEFCRRPERAPDLVIDLESSERGAGRDSALVPAWKRYWRVIADLVRAGEYELVARKAVRVGRRLTVSLLPGGDRARPADDATVVRQPTALVQPPP